MTWGWGIGQVDRQVERMNDAITNDHGMITHAYACCMDDLSIGEERKWAGPLSGSTVTPIVYWIEWDRDKEEKLK